MSAPSQYHNLELALAETERTWRTERERREKAEYLLLHAQKTIDALQKDLAGFFDAPVPPRES